MGKVNVGELDSLNEEELIPLKMNDKIECVAGESLLFFGKSKLGFKNYRIFYGIGKVYRVVKGDKQDLIYINFSVFGKHNTRLVVAYDNHPRRQVLTLKRGQICHVYGISRYYTTDLEINGVKKKRVRLGLYACALQGWYVPSMMDIKKMPVNDDLVPPTEKETELQQTFEEVLNEFMSGYGEEEEPWKD